MKTRTIAGALALLLCGITGCDAGTTVPAFSERALPPPNAVIYDGEALRSLAEVEIKGRAPKTGYDREIQFGPTWFDQDKNGCDTRNDILTRDLQAKTYRAGGCVVLTGWLADPYSSKVIEFKRGPDSGDVQVDHVVALSDAWQKGAQQLSYERRVEFANDPLNLLAVDGRLNASKGDGDAATWLPPAVSYRCPMVARQVAVKVKYDLWATQAEHDTIASILSTCPDVPLPAG